MSTRLWIILWFSIALSVGEKFPFILLGPNGLLVGSIFWALVSAFVLWVLFHDLKNQKEESYSNPFSHRGLIVAALAMTGLGALAFDLLQMKHFAHLGYSASIDILLLDGLLLGFSFWIFLKKGPVPPAARVFLFAAGFSCLHEVLSIIEFPLNPFRSDMMEAIRQAGMRLWTGGMMYGPSENGIGQMPYPPGTVLSYLPASVLNLDLRWMNILYRAGSTLLVWRWGGRSARTFLPWVWMHPYFLFRHEVYIEPFLFFLTLVMVSQGWVARMFAQAAAMFTLHWAWVFFPFVWMRSAWDGRKWNWKKVFICAGMTIATLGLGFGWIIAHEGEVFMNAIFMHTRWINEGRTRAEMCLGFGAIALHAGFYRYLFVGQILALLGMGVFALRSVRRDPMQWIAPTLLLFIMLLGFVENYFYLPVLWLGAFGLGGESRRLA